MEVEETVLVEIVVHSHCHIVANAEHGTECVGAQTHVGVLTHIFECLALLLHGVIVGTCAVEHDVFALDFHTLTSALALYELTSGTDTCASGNVFEQIFVNLCWVDHDLHILDC